MKLKYFAIIFLTFFICPMAMAVSLLPESESADNVTQADVAKPNDNKALTEGDTYASNSNGVSDEGGNLHISTNDQPQTPQPVLPQHPAKPSADSPKGVDSTKLAPLSPRGAASSSGELSPKS